MCSFFRRLFRTFNELFSILNNIIFPPVLETSKKKVQIKIEEYDLQVNYIYELNLMVNSLFYTESSN